MDDETIRPGPERLKRARGRQRAPRTKTTDQNGEVPYVRYSAQVAQAICGRLAEGEIWFHICSTPGMPSYGALYKWIRKYPEFAEAYAQAREMAADLRADEALVVAEASTPATVQSDRLLVNTLQWRAAKAAPKRYGARAEAADEEERGRDGPRLIIEVRRFEKVVRPDGTLVAREIAPERSRRRRSRR